MNMECKDNAENLSKRKTWTKYAIKDGDIEPYFAHKRFDPIVKPEWRTKADLMREVKTALIPSWSSATLFQEHREIISTRMSLYPWGL